MYKILVCEESLSSSPENIFPLYQVDVARNIHELLEFTYENSYNLYLLHFECYKIREELRNSDDMTSTIFIDEFYSIYNLKKAFKIADDYMIKPLYLEELKIKVDYHYRKLYKYKNDIIIYKKFYFHVNSKQLFLGTQKIKLSPSELKLLELFLSYQNKPLSKDIIYDLLESSSDGSLRVYISKLNKLGFDITYDRALVSYSLLAFKQ